MHERGRGAVIFTGSVAGRQPLPLHGVYAATKAFDLLLGEALFVEQRDPASTCSCSSRAPRRPSSSRSRGETAAPGRVARGGRETALDALGRQPSVVSGWCNWLRANAAQRLAPRSLVAHAAHEYTRRQTPEDLKLAPARAARHWLVKSEPGTYSGTTSCGTATRWDGVRNAQARNNLAAMRVGDRALFYHSGESREIVGVAEVVRDGVPRSHHRRRALARGRPRAACRAARARGARGREGGRVARGRCRSSRRAGSR